MLIEINIQNIALIQSARVEFAPGMNVLTGETGAGKSILIDALSLALGRRGGKELVRIGADRARVQALFDVSGLPRLSELLRELGVEGEEEGSLVLAREITAKGKSTCRVNGQLLPLSAMQRIGGQLVDIHGQHESQAIFQRRRQLEILDRMAGVGEALPQYREALARAREMHKLLADYAAQEKERLQRIDMLAFQVEELCAAGLKAGEQEALTAQRKQLRNGEFIQQGLYQIYDGIQGGESNALQMLDQVLQVAEGLAPLHPDYAALHESLQSAYYELEAVGLDARELKNGFDFSPEALETVEERLQALTKLSRKYGGSDTDMLAYLQSAQAELSELRGQVHSEQDLAEQLKRQTQECVRQGRELRVLRQQAAQTLQASMQAQFAELALKGARFEVGFNELPAKVTLAGCHATGLDEVEFRFCANPGMPLAPLASTISGGEASRVMLAIKATVAGQDTTPTLIFDEIDTGISGQVAHQVAHKMLHIAGEHQVLCVTHLVQIAAAADAQYRVQKTQSQDATQVSVTRLNDPARRRELARLSGGEEDSTAALEHVEELIRKAREGR